jgi:hypothetical protein
MKSWNSKKTTSELKESVISIAAILNKHWDGELYFAVCNDRSPLGMDISEKTLRGVSQAVANHSVNFIYVAKGIVFRNQTLLQARNIAQFFSSEFPIGEVLIDEGSR